MEDSRKNELLKVVSELTVTPEGSNIYGLSREELDYSLSALDTYKRNIEVAEKRMQIEISKSKELAVGDFVEWYEDKRTIGKVISYNEGNDFPYSVDWLGCNTPNKERRKNLIMITEPRKLRIVTEFYGMIKQ